MTCAKGPWALTFKVIFFVFFSKCICCCNSLGASWFTLAQGLFEGQQLE
jgi:hypothetical protein